MQWCLDPSIEELLSRKVIRQVGSSGGNFAIFNETHSTSRVLLKPFGCANRTDAKRCHALVRAFVRLRWQT